MMKLEKALEGVSLLFLDSAPVIYYIEGVASYCRLLDDIMKAGSSGQLRFVTSPITLAECLVQPFRKRRPDLVDRFRRVITAGRFTSYASLDSAAEQAAEIRATLGFTLTDALQIACARSAGCDAFLTNDKQLRRAGMLNVLVLDDMEP